MNGGEDGNGGEGPTFLYHLCPSLSFLVLLLVIRIIGDGDSDW